MSIKGQTNPRVCQRMKCVYTERSIHILEYYTTRKKSTALKSTTVLTDLEDGMLTDRHQTQKDAQCGLLGQETNRTDESEIGSGLVGTRLRRGWANCSWGPTGLPVIICINFLALFRVCGTKDLEEGLSETQSEDPVHG